jgi:predicted NAD/FAD-binding protein
MWRPLCIAALNTPPERASAQVFLHVLHDSLGNRRAASDMLLPRVDLTSLFPHYASMFIERNGGIVKCGTSVRRIRPENSGWRVDTGDISGAEDDSASFDAVIIATQPNHAAGLLNDLVNTDTLKSFSFEPITTCYLQYPSDVTLPRPFFALIDDGMNEAWGQFVFDRGQLDKSQAGLLAVVISASTDAIAFGQQILPASIARQLAVAFRLPVLKHPVWTKVISEKRATFSCIPALVRPDNATGLNGLILAGDYTTAEYPATLESSVRSGLKAARCVTHCT